MTTFSKENITKVPAMLHFKKNGDILHFNSIFEGLDIVGAKLVKSGEWFFGIYNGATMQGYLHFGEIPKADHHDIIKDVFPEDRNNLDMYIKNLSGRIEYHISTAKAWLYIGEIDKRKIIIKK